MTDSEVKRVNCNSFCIAALVSLSLAVASLSFCVFQLNKKVDSFSSSVSFVKHKIHTVEKNQEAVYSFDSKEGFEEAVGKVLSRIDFQTQQSALDRKYAKFSAAPLHVSGGTHLYGEPNARFSLIEFSDLECIYCNRFHDTPQKVVDMNPTSVNLQWKNNPLSMHDPAAYTEAVAAECVADQVGNRAFWAFVDDVFDQTRGNGRGLPNLETVAEGVGADLEAFHTCMTSNAVTPKVQADLQSAKTYGINSTPVTVAIDNTTGQMTQILGAVSTKQVMSALQNLAKSTGQQ